MRRSGVFVVGMALAMWYGLVSDTGAQGKPIKIGIPQAMTGAVGWAGVTSTRAAQIAADEINAKGGINGRKVELVARDDEHNPTKHVAAVRELVEKESVSVMFGPTASTAGLAVAPILNDELHVPMILPFSAATEIVWNKAWQEKKPNYLYRYGMFDAGQAKALVEFATKKLKKTKLAIIVENSGWGEGGRVEMAKTLKEANLTPVAEEKFNFKDTDLTAQLGRAQRAGADTVLFYGQVAEATAMLRSMAKMGYRPTIVSAWGVANAQFWNNAKELAEGVYVLTTATPDGPQSKARQAFVEEFERRHGKGSITTYPGALHSYDIVKLIEIAIRKSGSDDPAKIRDGLEDIPSFKGLLRDFNRPVFTRDRHDALLTEDL
ncbi:MAG: ABC transporter substrate-binding protein, partial [Candidatus Rokuibacteriota bacterium]